MFRLISLVRWDSLRIGLCVTLLTAVACMQAVLADWQIAASTDADADSVRLPIVMYHGIMEESGRQGPYVISPQEFERDLQHLQQQGYTTVTVADLISYVDEGTPLPDRPIMLTFDDGYYNNYRYAYPPLQKYTMRAVISPIVRWSAFYSENVGEQNRSAYSHITWEQIRQMVDSGTIEIQNHSYDMHYNTGSSRKGVSRKRGESVEQYRAALRQDLMQAQDMLRTETGVEPTAFTYPFGAVSPQTDELLRQMGFRATLGCEERMNRITADPDCLYRLGRYLRPHGVDSAAYFADILK